MDSDKLESQMKYVEANGCCLNIDEKMRLCYAIEELKLDLNISDPVYLVAKVSGKYETD